MSTPTRDSNNSPSPPEEKKEREEFHAAALPAEDEGKSKKFEENIELARAWLGKDEEKMNKFEENIELARAWLGNGRNNTAESQGVKRRSSRERGGEEGKLKKLKSRNYRATFEENIESARLWLEEERINTAMLKHNVESAGALLEMQNQLDDYGINLNQYSGLSAEELVPKIKEDYAAAKRAKVEDPTDELWTLPAEIRAEIAAWKREAGLPEKFIGIHDCQGRSVDRPDVGCDFAVFVEDIYVCKGTGIVHVCVGEPCSRATRVADGDLVCTISASGFPYPDMLFPDEEIEIRWQHEKEWRWEQDDEDDFNLHLSEPRTEEPRFYPHRRLKMKKNKRRLPSFR